MRVSTARSVSVTRSTAGLCVSRRDWSNDAMWVSTVLLRACGFGGGFCGDDALSRLFGDGDHEVMDLLEVEICHCNVLARV